MKEKANVFLLLQYAAKDEGFRDCWRHTAEAEEAFGVVRSALSGEQLEILEKYLATREQLGMALAQSAYTFGKESEKKTSSPEML